jgi:hypothetical protein
VAFLTSCSVTTPPAPLAETRAMSMPSLRASARTAGTALTPPIATACSLTTRSLLSIAPTTVPASARDFFSPAATSPPSSEAMTLRAASGAGEPTVCGGGAGLAAGA